MYILIVLLPEERRNFLSFPLLPLPLPPATSTHTTIYPTYLLVIPFTSVMIIEDERDTQLLSL
jgi:hypothetical protein